MAYSTLPKSGLRIPTDYGQTDWLGTFNYDFTRLNNTLLKYSALLDVDVSGLSGGDVLRYNSSTQKFEVFTPPYPADSTTTTTTTTTTVTSTTTTTTV
jgi:hypothetical protein